MFPFGFAVGLLSGVAAALVVGPEIVQRTRPIAKAALKAALMAVHETQVRGAEIAEAAEDLFAEAKSEVTAEVFAAAMAAAQAKAAEQAANARAQAMAAQASPAPEPEPQTTKAARRRTAVKRSRVKIADNA